MSASQRLDALLSTVTGVTQEDTNETKENDDSENNVCMKWNKNNIQNYDTFILDCDGVIYLSKTPIPGAKQVLHELVSLNKQIIFLSNNSSRDIAMYINKFKKLFDLNVEANQVFTSAVAAASYVSLVLPKVQQYLQNNVKILLVGSIGLYNILQTEIEAQKNVSIIWTRKDIPKFDELSVSDLVDMELDPNVAIVVAGMDLSYGYRDISLVCRYLNEMKHEVHLVGTNDDQTFPAAPGVLLAGTGALLAAIKAVSPIPMKVCGKPHKLLFDLIKSKHDKMDVDKCLMIGDRLSTDIVFGTDSGMDTALVMTGITTERILEKSEIKPTFILPSIADLL
eukprot:164770_1